MNESPGVIASGAWPVLLTPFNEDGSIAWPALDELVDFYLRSGVAGVFACCQSSEVFALTPGERVQLARRVLKTVDGRVPVVGGAGFSQGLDQIAAEAEEMCALGADSAVLLLSVLPSPDDLAGQLLALADLTSVPLGIYECPTPVHRRLGADEVGRIARSGRFVFMKDTSPKPDECVGKVLASVGTALRFFPAASLCLSDALDAGAAGYCGILANVCPELCVAACDPATEGPRRSELIGAMRMIEAAIGHGYPASAKYMLGRRGLTLTDMSRIVAPDAFGAEHRSMIDGLVDGFDFTRTGGRSTCTRASSSQSKA